MTNRLTWGKYSGKLCGSLIFSAIIHIKKRFLKYQKPFCVLGRILFSFSFETVRRRYLFGFFLFDFSMFSAFGSQGFAFGKTFPAFDDGALLRLSAMASVRGIGRRQPCLQKFGCPAVFPDKIEGKPMRQKRPHSRRNDNNSLF